MDWHPKMRQPKRIANVAVVGFAVDAANVRVVVVAVVVDFVDVV